MDALSRMDALAGAAIERTVRAKHGLRLRRLGWERALDPPDDGPFCAGEPQARDGCAIDVLIDGAEALPAIAAAIRGARESVWITGWHVAPHFELERDERHTPVGA